MFLSLDLHDCRIVILPVSRYTEPVDCQTCQAFVTAYGCYGNVRCKSAHHIAKKDFSTGSLPFLLSPTPTPFWLVGYASRVALTYTAPFIAASAAQYASRPDLMRSPKHILAHTWECF